MGLNNNVFNKTEKTSKSSQNLVHSYKPQEKKLEKLRSGIKTTSKSGKIQKMELTEPALEKFIPENNKTNKQYSNRIETTCLQKSTTDSQVEISKKTAAQSNSDSISQSTTRLHSKSSVTPTSDTHEEQDKISLNDLINELK